MAVVEQVKVLRTLEFGLDGWAGLSRDTKTLSAYLLECSRLGYAMVQTRHCCGPEPKFGARAERAVGKPMVEWTHGGTKFKGKRNWTLEAWSGPPELGSRPWIWYPFECVTASESLWLYK